MQDRIFFSICSGFIFGVFLRSFVFVNPYFLLSIFILSIFLLLFTYFTKLKWGIIFTVFVLTFSIGVWRFHLSDKPIPFVFENLVGQRTTFVGYIIDDPEQRENNQKLTVKVKKDEDSVKILISTDQTSVYKYGDYLSFSGVLEEPENFLTDQGKVFDYVNYLHKDGITYLMYYPEIEVLSSGHGNFLKSILFTFKNKFLEKINLSIRHPENLLMGGLILGERAPFNEKLRQNFIDTGTIHIVALSGYNITIVAEWFMKIFAYFPQGLGVSAGIFSIFLFILMTGGTSTALRAGIMASLALYARWSGRHYAAARALLLAGVIMVLINPMILVFDVSFQLSFLATFALIFLTPKVEKYFLWIPKSFGLRDVSSVTFAVYIFVLPFIIYKMGNLSLVALLANILILPFIPITMIFGFITGALGFLHYFISVPAGILSYVLLHYELGVIGLLAKIPYASISIPDFPLLLTIAIYFYFTYKLFSRVIKNFFTEPF